MSEFVPPTKEITTPIGKHKVVIKQFISGFDDEAIESIYTRGKHEIEPMTPEEAAAIKAGKAAPKNKMSIDGSSIQEAEREAVKRVVISVDANDFQGDKDAILNAVYEMQKEDTKFVKAEVDKIVNPKEDSLPKK